MLPGQQGLNPLQQQLIPFTQLSQQQQYAGVNLPALLAQQQDLLRYDQGAGANPYLTGYVPQQACFGLPDQLLQQQLISLQQQAPAGTAIPSGLLNLDLPQLSKLLAPQQQQQHRFLPGVIPNLLPAPTTLQRQQQEPQQQQQQQMSQRAQAVQQLLLHQQQQQQQQQQGDDEADEPQEQEYVFLGRFRTAIVGIRYYTGRVGVNEMVGLVREPENPYDANAIRVENIAAEKVGHLNRQLAAQIASLLDNGSVRIEGVMPGGSKSSYTLPLDVYCFGTTEAMRSTLQQRLLRADCQLQVMTLEQALASQASAQRSAGGASTSRAAAAAAGGAAAAAAATVTLAPTVMEASLSRMFEDLYHSSGLKPQMDACEEVVSQLFPHQREALAWMVGRENSNALPPFWIASQTTGSGLLYTNSLTNFETTRRPDPLRGGILADDMGLGKTLMIISLIATNAPGATLPPLMTPTAEGEAAAAAAAGGDVGEEPPAKRRKKGSKAAAAAAAASSSSKLQVAAQKAQQKAAAAIAAAEPPPSPPAAGGPRGTLIVCPLSVLSNWQTQIEEHTGGNLQVGVYHGPDRSRSKTWLASQDVVLTTYQTLAGDMGQGQQLSRRSGLGAVDWLRVVLDEAHTIRNSNTQQAKACLSLKAERRWAVTGTPLQNRLRDVHGIIVFLGLTPLNERSYWQRCVERPLKARSDSGLMALKILMGSLALRRTKNSTGADGRPMVTLPSKTVQLVTLDLGPEDAANYQALESETRSLVADHLSRGTLVQNFTHVLAVIMRLRQVCDSSFLCPGALEALKAAVAAAKAAAGGAAAAPPPELLAKLLAALAGDECAEECAVCLSPLEGAVITTCGHIFCRRCIEAVIVRDKPSCPLCRTPISSRDLIDPPPPEAADTQGGGGSSQGGPSSSSSSECSAIAGCSKLQALLIKLREVEAANTQAAAAAAASGSPLPTPAKSVVFSQFMGMLDLVAAALAAEGIPYVRLDGKSTAAARTAAIRAFAGAGPDSPRVFLASLKAAGLGTNLTAASNVHMMDPWWNPAVEDQAMDRVHRLGQTRPVFVWRYVARGTIEERMLEMQERKTQLARAAWMGEQVGVDAAAAAAAGSSNQRLLAGQMGVRADDIRQLMGLS